MKVKVADSTKQILSLLPKRSDKPVQSQDDQPVNTPTPGNKTSPKKELDEKLKQNIQNIYNMGNADELQIK